MGARPLDQTTYGLDMLASLPPRVQGSIDYQAVIHAQAREVDLLEASMESVRNQFNPATADVLLGAWEAQVWLPVGGAGATVPQRQAKVLLRLQKLLGASEGTEWQDQITALVGQGWTYEEHIAGDGTSPPANTLRITLPFAPDGGAYAEALREIREYTPSHLDIEFASAGGFVLDESQIDQQELDA